MLAARRRRLRPAARLRRRPRAGVDGARRACRASTRSRIDPMVLLFTLGVSVVAGLLFGIIPVVEVRDAAARRRAEGRRAAVERGARASPRAQHAGRRGDRAGGRPAGRLRPDDPHVPGHAPGRSRVHEPRRGPDAARLDPRIAGRRPRADRAHAPADRRPHRAAARRHLGRHVVVDHDGRLRQQRSDLRRRLPGPGGRIPPLRRFKWVGGLLRDDGQSRRRGPGAAVVRQHTTRSASSWSARTSRASSGRSRPRRSAGASARGDSPWRTIVGVVGDERDDGVARPAPAIVYWPVAAWRSSGTS